MQIFDWVTSSHYRLLALLRSVHNCKATTKRVDFARVHLQRRFFRLCDIVSRAFFLPDNNTGEQSLRAFVTEMEPVPVEKKLRPMIAARERGANAGLIISTHFVTKSIFMQVLDQGDTNCHHVSAK